MHTLSMKQMKIQGGAQRFLPTVVWILKKRLVGIWNAFVD